MNRKRSIVFSLVRGLAAILIALAVATLLIFISSEGESLAEKLAATGDALRQLLIGPLFRSSGGLNTKNLSDILAAMIPTIFTGLGVCVMFSANEFNMAQRAAPSWALL